MLCYLLFVCCCPRRSWHLICRPSEGREAEVTYRHDSKWLRCGCRDKHNRPRCGSNLGPLTLQSSLHHHGHTAVGRAHHQTTATCVWLHLLVHLHDTNLLSGLSSHHLALAALASQPLKSGTLSLHLSSPDTFRRHLKTHYCQQALQSTYPSSLLAPQIRLLLTIVRVYKLYLLTYLLMSSALRKGLC